jgi:hypothetical protein
MIMLNHLSSQRLLNIQDGTRKEDCFRQESSVSGEANTTV